MVTRWPGRSISAGSRIWHWTARGSWPSTDLSTNPVTFDWPSFSRLAKEERVSDIHCVTSWSLYDNRWRGLPIATLIDMVAPLPEAQAVMVHSYDGYSTNLKLADFAAPEALLAHSWNGSPLDRAHGGPVRLVVPHLYFWKSAKWVSRIEFIDADRPGFWEQNGYNMHGDPWNEERYA